METLSNDAHTPPADGKPTLTSRVLEVAGELLHIVIISLAIIVPVRYFLIQPFYVKGASMEPNFHDHEYLIIDEIGYRFREPARGEIVVFRYPNDPREYFIKRVIGLPGERVKVSNGKVTVYNEEYPDGKTLDERSYLGNVATSGEIDRRLGPGEYFVLGDNRGASLDSRIFGPVPRKDIVGRVWFRGWPLDRLKFFPTMPESSMLTSV